MSEQLKACKNCVHFSDEGDLFLFCNKYTFDVGDVITGEVEIKKTLCAIARDDEGGRCGLEARGYEPKAVTNQPSRHDSPMTAWQHFKAMLHTFFG